MRLKSYLARGKELKAIRVVKGSSLDPTWPYRFEDYWFDVLGVKPAKHHLDWIEATIDSKSAENQLLYTLSGPHLEIRAPRDSAKSTFCALLAAWAIGTNPGIRLIYTSYSDPIALEQSRRIKRIIKSPEYQRIFPWIRIGSRDNEHEWEIDKNWAIVCPKPPEIKIDPNAAKISTYTFYAVGILGSVMGHRADLIISDDLIKSASSIANADVRYKIQENVNDVLRPCLVPGGRWIDVGMLCRSGDIHLTYFLPRNGFSIIKTSAIREGISGEESYWPSRFTLENLQAIRERSPRTFSLQYQNEVPSAEDENAIDSEWLHWTDAADFSRYLLTIDLASGDSVTSDYTSFCLSGLYVMPNGSKLVTILSIKNLKRHGNLSILKDILQYRRSFHPLVVGFESNAYQLSLKGDYQTFSQSPEGLLLADTRIYPVPGIKKLGERLEGVTGLLENGLVKFKSSGAGLSRLHQNLLSDLTTLPHDDDISAFVLNLEIARRLWLKGESWSI